MLLLSFLDYPGDCCEPVWRSGNDLVRKTRGPGFNPRQVQIFSPSQLVCVSLPVLHNKFFLFSIQMFQKHLAHQKSATLNPTPSPSRGALQSLTEEQKSPTISSRRKTNSAHGGPRSISLKWERLTLMWLALLRELTTSSGWLLRIRLVLASQVTLHSWRLVKHVFFKPYVFISGVPRALLSGWLAHLRAKITTKMSKVGGKHRNMMEIRGKKCKESRTLSHPRLWGWLQPWSLSKVTIWESLSFLWQNTKKDS